MKQTATTLAPIILLLLSGCAPRITYVQPVNAFSVQTEKLGTAVSSELTNFNTQSRTTYYRQDVFQKIGAQIPPTTPNVELKPFKEYLCEPKRTMDLYTSNSKYLTAMAGNLKNVSADPDKETKDLIKSMFNSYKITPPITPTKMPNPQCVEDIKNYYSTAYPTGRTESGAGVVEGVQELWKMLDTLTNATLKEIDEGRRAAALRAFFSNEKYVKSLKSVIDENATFLSDAATKKRHLDIFNAKRSYSTLSEKYSEISIAKTKECLPLITTPPTVKLETDKNFQNCFDKIWDSAQKDIQPLLDAAAIYDKDAAKNPDLASVELQKSIDELVEIAKNENIDSERLRQMYDALKKAAAAISTLSDNLDDQKTKDSVNEALNKIRGDDK